MFFNFLTNNNNTAKKQNQTKQKIENKQLTQVTPKTTQTKKKIIK